MCASGYVNEENEIRKYGAIAVNVLMRQGYTMVNCTPPNNAMSDGASLAYRVNKANASGSILHICMHVNAFKTTASAMGAEIEEGSDSGTKYATSILTEIHKLGFAIHGGLTISDGIRKPNLYVTRNTKMACVLIEPFFVDSKSDVALYNCNTLGLAIAKGVLNILGSHPVDTGTQGSTSTFKKNVTVTASALNCRKTPITGAIIKTFKRGDVVTYVGLSTDKKWGKLVTKLWIGWICLQYTK